MKAGWRTLPLGELCEIRDSERRPITKRDRKPGPYPYYGATGVQDYVDGYLFDEPLVLVGEDGAKWGPGEPSAYAVEGKVWVNNHAHVLRPVRDHILDSWLIYYLNSADLTPFVSGLTVPKLNQGNLRQVPVLLPPLPEQRRIVTLLDEAFDGIAKATANAEKNIENARAAFESHLDAVFSQSGASWMEKRLSEVALDFGRGKSRHRPRNDPKLYGGKYPFIQTAEVRGSDHLITDYSQTYNEVGLAQSKLWPAGTLCITIAANIAETGILGFDACFPDSVIGVVVNPKVTSNSFLEYLLQSVRARLKAQGKGSAQDNINLGTFENQTFLFPDLKTQARVVELLDVVRQNSARLVDLFRQKVAALDELKKSMLHQAFAGQL